MPQENEPLGKWLQKLGMRMEHPQRQRHIAVATPPNRAEAETLHPQVTTQPSIQKESLLHLHQIEEEYPQALAFLQSSIGQDLRAQMIRGEIGYVRVPSATEKFEQLVGIYGSTTHLLEAMHNSQFGLIKTAILLACNIDSHHEYTDAMTIPEIQQFLQKLQIVAGAELLQDALQLMKNESLLIQLQEVHSITRQGRSFRLEKLPGYFTDLSLTQILPPSTEVGISSAGDNI
jgi:hypothetical protein